MAKISSKIRFELDFLSAIKDLPKKIPRRQLKKKVGELLVDEIKEFAQSGESPVRGHGKFQRYTSDYAAKKGVSRSDVDLTDTERMLNSLSFVQTANGVSVGVRGALNEKKAETHNLGTQRSKGIPVRRFIPVGNEQFKAKIIKKVVSEALRDVSEQVGVTIKKTNR